MTLKSFSKHWLFVFFFSFNFFCWAQPVNDLCQNAIDFNVGNQGFALGQMTQICSLAQSTLSSAEFVHPDLRNVNIQDKSIWLKFNIGTARKAKINLSIDPIYINSVGMTIYKSSNCSSMSLASSNASGFATLPNAGQVSTNANCLLPGTYYIQIVARSFVQSNVSVSLELNSTQTLYDDFSNAKNLGVVSSMASFVVNWACFTIDSYDEICGVDSSFSQSAWAKFTTSSSNFPINIDFYGRISIFEIKSTGLDTLVSCVSNFEDSCVSKFKPNTNYAIQMMQSGDFTQNSLLQINVNQYITDSPNPKTIPSYRIHILPNDYTEIQVNDVMGCNALLSSNVCLPIVDGLAQGFYNYSTWEVIEIPTKGAIHIPSTSGRTFKIFEGNSTLDCDLNCIGIFADSVRYCDLNPGVYTIQTLSRLGSFVDYKIKYYPFKFSTVEEAEEISISAGVGITSATSYSPCNTDSAQLTCYPPDYYISNEIKVIICNQDTVYQEITYLINIHTHDTIVSPFFYCSPEKYEGFIFRVFEVNFPSEISAENVEGDFNFMLFKGNIKVPGTILEPLTSCDRFGNLGSFCMPAEQGWYTLVTFIPRNIPFPPIPSSIKITADSVGIPVLPLFNTPQKAWKSSINWANTGSNAYPNTTTYFTTPLDYFSCEQDSTPMLCCPVGFYNHSMYYSLEINQFSTLRIQKENKYRGLSLTLLRGDIQANPSIVLDSSNIISKCWDCDFLEIYNISPGQYSIIVLGNQNTRGKPFQLKLSIDKVGTPPMNDHFYQAYDFGILPSGKIWENPNIPNNQPFGRKGSYTEFNSATQYEHRDSIYSIKKVPDSLSYYPNPNIFPYPNEYILRDTSVICKTTRKSAWFTFVAEGQGVIRLDPKWYLTDDYNYEITVLMLANDASVADLQSSNFYEIGNFSLVTDALQITKKSCGNNRFFVLIESEFLNRLSNEMELGVEFIPEIRSNGDSCNNPLEFNFSQAQQSLSQNVVIDCHTWGGSFGEDQPGNIGCLHGYKTTWFKIHIPDNLGNVSLTLNLTENTALNFTNFSFRLLSGDCENMWQIACSPSLSSFNIECLPPGDYYVQVASPNTNGSIELQAIISPQMGLECSKVYPQAHFNFEKNCGSFEVQFTNTSIPIDTCFYRWDFGDQTTSTEIHPIHVFPDSGYYLVQLIAQGYLGGIRDTIEQWIYIDPIYSDHVYQMSVCLPFEKNLVPTYSNGIQHVWNNGSNSQNIQVDQTGMYEVIYNIPLADGKLCPVKDTYMIKYALEFDTLITLPCPENNNGSIEFITNAQVFSETGVKGPIFNHLSVGTYHFQISDTNIQCSKEISIYLGPLIDFHAHFHTNPELPVIFDEDSSMVQMIPDFIDSTYLYFWDFGDGEFSSSISPFHHFDAGNHLVKLRIRDIYGRCVVEYTKNCSIDYFPKISIPNVFTPNADGVNDLFVIQAEHLLKYDLIIYDRWGKSIFTNNGKPNQYWNGLDTQGKTCAEGTYFYTIQWHFKDNRTLQKSGHLTLLR